MNHKKRKEIIQQFKTDSEVKVFLISIKVGGVGLNLVEANNVVILEPWWNPAVEDQAMDRVNRIGQKRDMKVYRLVTKDSIEERICAIREEKRQLFKLTIENYKDQSNKDIDEQVANELSANKFKFLLNAK
jgi:DNA repair protein RAD5